MAESLDDAFMKGKEEIALQHVKYLTEKLELKMTPRVVFCDGFTPAGQNALACIDTATWTIYISRVYLSQMDATQIKETIAHEITHLFDPTHDPSFHKKLSDINSTLWKPESTSGIVWIDGGRRTEETPDKPTKRKINKIRCNYHLCRKKTELIQCCHCKDYFCIDHIRPVLPCLPNFDMPKEFADWKDKDKCHPCPDYYYYLVEKDKERIRKTEESLNRMNNLGFRYERVEITKKENIFEVIPEENIEDVLPKSEEKSFNCEKCGRRTSQRDIKKIFSSILDRNVYLCSSCYSFGNKVLEQIEHDNQKEDRKKIEKEKPDEIKKQKKVKQKIKVISILLIVLIVAGVVLGFIFFKGSEQSNLNKKDLVTIADLKQNLQKYINQTVTIKASYVNKYHAINWTYFRLNNGTEQMGAIAYDYIDQSAISNKDVNVFYWEGKIREATYNGVIEPQLVVTKIQI